jgi:outer membrane protein TolC
MLQVAEAGYAAGRSLQQDVFQAQVEVGNLFDEQVGLESSRRTLAARINELLNRPDAEEIAVSGAFAFPELSLDPAAIRQLALTYHPMLRVRQADIDHAALNVDLARKDYYPDLDVNIAYGQREEDLSGRDLPDFVSGSVTVNVPLWRKKKQDKQLAAAQNRYKAAAKSYENLRLTLPHQVEAVLGEITAAQENHRLFRGGLLEQTRNWSLATLSAYEVGKVDFDTMIEANVRALRFELQAERYRYQLYQKLTELEVLAGIVLQDIPPPPYPLRHRRWRCPGRGLNGPDNPIKERME